jgi:hypothetical protein
MTMTDEAGVENTFSNAPSDIDISATPFSKKGDKCNIYNFFLEIKK